MNKFLKEHDLPSFKAGIGLGYSEVLLVNTARGEIDIDDKIWIGDAVIDACNFSSVANKDEYKEIVMSKEFYDNLAKINNQAKETFEMKHHPAYGEIYTGESLIPEFNKWIDKVVCKCCNDITKCSTNDNTYCHVHHVAFYSKLFEFFNETHNFKFLI